MSKVQPDDVALLGVRRGPASLQIPQGGSPEEFASFLAQDSDNWGRIVAKAGIRIE